MPDPAMPSVRRLVVAAALFLGLAAAVATRPPAVLAQAPAAAPDTGEYGTTTPVEPAPAPESAPAKSPRKPGVRIEISAGDKDDAASTGPARSGVTVEKNGKKVRVTGSDREAEAIQRLLGSDEARSGMMWVATIVAIVFLSPVLIVALFIGYRMRKARLQNETMLKLAERGVIAPGEAMQALSLGQVPPAVAAATAGAAAGAVAASAAAPPLAEQARELRRQAARSDLRKAIFLGAAGLALTFDSAMDDGTPNAVGLILLFIGVGYGVLWWFETRQLGAWSDGGSAGGSAKS
jgi:hypothetical protein